MLFVFLVLYVGSKYSVLAVRYRSRIRSYLAFRVVSRCDAILARCGGGFPRGGGGRAGSGSLPLSCSGVERTHTLPSPSLRGLTVATPILAAGGSWPASRLLSTRAAIFCRPPPRFDCATTGPLDLPVGLHSLLVVALIREVASAFLLSRTALGEGGSTALRIFECLLGST